MILTNLLFVIACTFLLGLQKLLYGSLRPIEIEQLYEKAWFAVTETCLAMTVFRGEIGLVFLAMFFSLLTGKVWGWIGEGRVEVLEQQPPRNPRLFHTRLALSLGLSVAFDLTMLEYVVKQVMRMARPDMMVMFGFEFAVLSIMSMSTAARYAINLIEIGIVREQKRNRIEEIKRERVQTAVSEFQESQTGRADGAGVSDTPGGTTTIPTPTSRTLDQVSQEALDQPVDENEIEVEGWEEKGRYMFYLNLATDFFKLVIYLAFFFILLVFYGLPIHILRDVFLTMRSFLKRISDFMKYRAATRDMNARYPDATTEDIRPEDVCIICREEMRPYQPPAAQEGQPTARPNPLAERMRPKKLPCGHILHFSCLRSWLERQQICPTCRANVVQPGRTQGGTDGTGQAVAPQADGRPPQPAARPGPRVYQFGPLRIGVGAARGNNMFEDLQQQLGQGRAGPLPPANAEADAPRQFGLGFRWGPSGRPQVREQAMTARQRLDALEAQIQRETEELARLGADVAAVRSMQAELQRLRRLRMSDVAGQENASMAAPVQVSGLPHSNEASLANTHPPPTRLAADTQQNLLQAGSSGLPAGLTLPEGWTMLPLQPTQNDVPLPPMQAYQMPPFWNMPAFGPMPFAQPPVPNGTASPMPFPNRPAANPARNGRTTLPYVPQATTQIQFDATAMENHQNLLLGHMAAHAAQVAQQEHLWRSTNGQHGAANASTTLPVNATDTNTSVPPADPVGTNPVALNGNQHAPTPPNNQAPAHNHLLPLWGDSASDPSNNLGESSVNAAPVNGTHIGESSAEPSSQTSEPKNRQATVEDLVEDPD